MPTDPSYTARIRQKYNEIGEIWEQSDKWHGWTRRQIENEMLTVAEDFHPQHSTGSLIVDVGSGGYSYFPAICRRVDVDIAEDRLKDCNLAICASVEALPLLSQISDLTICVGPVMNYCSLEESLFELRRITKVGGQLILHVELSDSWEFFGSKAHRRDAAFVSTFYKGIEQYWVYSDRYVRRMLALNGLAVSRVRYFHFLSSLIYRLTGRPNLSAFLASVDPVLRLVNFRLNPDSGIFVCRRTT